MKLDRVRLQQAREQLGYGIEKTAKEAGVSKNSVLRAEHEQDIRPVTVRKIARALGVPVAELLPKAQAPLFRELPEQEPAGARDPRASELRRENYLTALLAHANQLTCRWEREIDERFSARTPEFFGWAREVLATANDFSSTLFDCDIFNLGYGTPSESEEERRRILLRVLGKMLRLTEQISAEWDRRVEEMKSGITKKERQEAEERRKLIREMTRRISA